jgi:peptidoglycan/xylan/chitin deacetylase (PgdA/CDA1 family)
MKFWRSVLGFFLAVVGLAFLSWSGVSINRYFQNQSSLKLVQSHLEESLIERLFQREKEKNPTANSVKAPIFIYHSVRPHIKNEAVEQDLYDITPELLESELKYLNEHGFTTILPSDLARYFDGQFNLPEKPVVLSFDDGWQNQYKNAFPLLKKYHAKAIFYIYTGVIGTNHFMTLDEIKELEAAGMAIGSHTLTHPFFRTTSEMAVRREIFESKKILERELGRPVTDFASPFGYSNESIRAFVKEAGYTTARTTYKGIYHSKADLLYLTGILTNDSFGDFIAVLNR